ncbi:hypothetical protein PT974_12432 [Cladobotryum mycophilum]|uniref:Uncharacterized protein n=1 Tax=Cladobotryum mycophilum TaxID=491253 RepID=A0ABR0S837_9HYPO
MQFACIVLATLAAFGAAAPPSEIVNREAAPDAAKLVKRPNFKIIYHGADM